MRAYCFVFYNIYPDSFQGNRQTPSVTQSSSLLPRLSSLFPRKFLFFAISSAMMPVRQYSFETSRSLFLYSRSLSISINFLINAFCRFSMLSLKRRSFSSCALKEHLIISKSSLTSSLCTNSLAVMVSALPLKESTPPLTIGIV